MTKKIFRAVKTPLTVAQRARRDRGVAEAERDREQIVAQGRELLRQNAALLQVFEALKAERLRQGLTLVQLEERTGIGKPALSRLENSAAANPTVRTVYRVAQALGKQIKIELIDDAKSSK